MHMIALCACVSTFVSLCVRACARARAAAAGDHRQSCFKCERQSRLASQPHPPLCPSPNREGPTAPPHLRTRRRRGGHTVPNPSSALRRQGGWVGGGGVRACVFACERARARVCVCLCVCVCVRARRFCFRRWFAAAAPPRRARQGCGGADRVGHVGPLAVLFAAEGAAAAPGRATHACAHRRALRRPPLRLRMRRVRVAC
jgi:hypothetical protein